MKPKAKPQMPTSSRGIGVDEFHRRVELCHRYDLAERMLPLHPFQQAIICRLYNRLGYGPACDTLEGWETR